MAALLRALDAELLKTKRTLTLWLCLLAPLALAFLEVAMGCQSGQAMYRPGTNPWQILAEHFIIIWTLLLLPLFVTLEMGLLAALEHGNKAWKQLYALSLPRWAVYAAKELLGLALIGLSTLLMIALIVVSGLALNLLQPQLGFAAAIPWSTILQGALLSYLASWLIISLHLWVSMHWASFVVAMGAGIVATIAGVLVIYSDWARYYPWTLPGMVGMGLMHEDPIGISLLLGIAGGIVVSLVGGWEVTRHDVL